jgi:hypothetical protein
MAEIGVNYEFVTPLEGASKVFIYNGDNYNIEKYRIKVRVDKLTPRMIAVATYAAVKFNVEVVFMLEDDYIGPNWTYSDLEFAVKKSMAENGIGEFTDDDVISAIEVGQMRLVDTYVRAAEKLFGLTNG